MKVTVNLLWVLLALFAALALAHVVGVGNPNEKVNGLWLVVAAACIYVLAYRFYGRWLARRVVGLNNRHVTPAVRLRPNRCENKTNLLRKHFLQGSQNRREGSRRDTAKPLDKALAIHST